MKKSLLMFLSLFCFIQTQGQVKKEIAVPNLNGYTTLKCDLHVHTIFSDGQVWPAIRIDEASKEGLDVIAITEHLEYQPWSADVRGSHNRSYEIAEQRAKELGIVVIKGSEITKGVMPPGHFNAIFLTDSEPLDHEDYMVQLKGAKDQDAFIFWNHPGWRAQQAETVWWPEHTEIYNRGYMQGIEVYNYNEYYPEAHQWALDRKLTILCNSDIHAPINMDYDLVNGHRPMTLVFAKERSVEGVREALFARRTAAYFDDILVAEEAYLKEIFENSIEVVSVERTANSVKATLINKSQIPFHIKQIDGEVPFKDFTVPALQQVSVTMNLPEGYNRRNVRFEVANLYAKPLKGLEYTFAF